MRSSSPMSPVRVCRSSRPAASVSGRESGFPTAAKFERHVAFDEQPAAAQLWRRQVAELGRECAVVGRCARGKAEGKRAVGVELTAVCPGAADPPGRQRRQPWQLRDAVEAVPRRRPGHREVAEQPAVGRQIAAAGVNEAVQPRARLNRERIEVPSQHVPPLARPAAQDGGNRRRAGRGCQRAAEAVGRSSVPCVRTLPCRCDEFRRPLGSYFRKWESTREV